MAVKFSPAFSKEMRSLAAPITPKMFIKNFENYVIANRYKSDNKPVSDIEYKINKNIKYTPSRNECMLALYNNLLDCNFIMTHAYSDMTASFTFCKYDTTNRGYVMCNYDDPECEFIKVRFNQLP